MYELSVIIVNAGLRGYPEECLEAVRAAPLPSGTEILLVQEDTLHDSHPGLMDSRLPLRHVPVAAASCAAARNAGLSAARGRLALLLDANVVVSPEAPQRLLRCLSEEASLIAAGAQLLRENGLPRRSARRFPAGIQQILRIRSVLRTLAMLLRVRPGPADPRRPPFHVDAPFGCCVMLRCEDARQVGPFDQQSGFQFDATDWFWRARRRGFRAKLVPGARAFWLPPQQRGMIPVEAYVAHQHAQYRTVARNRNRVYARAFSAMRIGVWAGMGVVCGLVAILTFSRSKHATHMWRVVWAVLRWHTRGRPRAPFAPEFESHVRWAPLG